MLLIDWQGCDGTSIGACPLPSFLPFLSTFHSYLPSFCNNHSFFHVFFKLSSILYFLYFSAFSLSYFPSQTTSVYNSFSTSTSWPQPLPCPYHFLLSSKTFQFFARCVGDYSVPAFQPDYSIEEDDETSESDDGMWYVISLYLL